MGTIPPGRACHDHREEESAWSTTPGHARSTGTGARQTMVPPIVENDDPYALSRIVTMLLTLLWPRLRCGDGGGGPGGEGSCPRCRPTVGTPE